MRGRPSGFSLIELMVTVAVMALLLTLVAPSIQSAIASAQSRTVVNKFATDFAWVRNQAATGSYGVTLAVNTDCSWTANVNGSTDTAHSMTATTISARAPSLGCALSSTANTTLSFSALGLVSSSPTLSTLSYTSTSGSHGGSGQSWLIQVFGSGSVAVNTGAAS